ncbi:hypothetical protein TCAL_10724 [Tigriopus californicus]|uniref:FAD dependent oxidoreductase domain-containing protein n=1 Tax=Tigriopus californicus TaxID=6832 RepID=A0A553PS58_TIGCA|nr:D-aspartate oxidase-like [Tigriopus californicus]TRY80505.1 hypothetical protein TCAL_10724 [Tigriopus californicus]|eukprot:TCALIF_10724-PA protein Name:"Similar to DDO D-aspartate oxidase (Bos taurus)" AED:0.08 eAED:0.08 QI:128/1/1/1/1/1/5/134/345
MSANRRVLILGCGSAGLNTALILQQEIPELEVTLMAKDFPPHTTSDVAAGIFRPGSTFQAPTEELRHEWLAFSWDYYTKLRINEDQSQTGIIEMPCYILTSNEKTMFQFPFLSQRASGFRECSKQELNVFQPPGKWVKGHYFRTMVIDNSRFLPWAMQRFTERGGKLISRQINSFEDRILKEFDVVINCTGLGSKYLCPDRKMVPVRGQVVKVKAPWMKMAVYGDAESYIIPGVDYVTLGGTRNFNNYSLDAEPMETETILKRACLMVPSLEKAEVVSERVGLRPHRHEVRLELETRSNGLKVVHNYGHCGYGVMASPGTSKHAVELVKESLRTENKSWMDKHKL